MCITFQKFLPLIIGYCQLMIFWNTGCRFLELQKPSISFAGLNWFRLFLFTNSVILEGILGINIHHMPCGYMLTDSQKCLSLWYFDSLFRFCQRAKEPLSKATVQIWGLNQFLLDAWKLLWNLELANNDDLLFDGHKILPCSNNYDLPVFFFPLVLLPPNWHFFICCIYIYRVLY
jgi:hypothetical protein